VNHFFEVSELLRRKSDSLKLYLEFLRVPAMSAGVYMLPAGAMDPQHPHSEDELYYVVNGRARMTVGAEERAVRAGSVIFVEANQEHRFYDILEDLAVLVFFAPAERG
jgi:mannose-6-phosphate isomerase-like protein (cupin superfamily)